MKTAKPALPPEGAEVFTLVQAAAFLQTTGETLARYWLTGALRGRKLGSSYRFTRVDLERFARKQRRMSARTSKVYFIQAANGAIKIGFTLDVARRLATLQNGSPERLKLLATMPGGEPEELALHERFAEFRQRGEWFAPARALVAFIRGLGGQQFRVRFQESA